MGECSWASMRCIAGNSHRSRLSGVGIHSTRCVLGGNALRGQGFSLTFTQCGQLAMQSDSRDPKQQGIHRDCQGPL